MKRIIIFERILTHYRMRFYNYIISGNPDIEIVFLTGELPKNQGFHTKMEEAKFDVRVLPKRNIFGLELYIWPDGLIKASECVVCVISLMSITNVYYAVVARLNSTPFYWWGHSQNFSEQGFVETLKDKIKLLSLVSSSGVLAYTFREKERFLKHRWLKTKNIVSLGNTLDTENILEINDSFRGHGFIDGSLDKTLENKSIIGILGRLHQKRNVSLGIELFLEILSDRSDLVLLIIGDGAEYPYLVDKYSSIKEIVFVGAIEEENELAHYMRRVDFFIHTGLVGLNLVHGMCYGKPSIVLDLPIHSPEIEYLRNEKNGILVRTTAEMKLAIFRLLSDRDEVNRLGVNALADIKLHLSIQNMSNNFLKILS